jgi:hypothetical protein
LREYLARGRTGGEERMRYKYKEKISRRGFLKLGFAGILGTMLLLLSGCLGEEFEDEDDDDGSGRRRRRRRR